MDLESKSYSAAEIVDAANERDGILAFYNKKGEIVILVFLILVISVYAFVFHDIHSFGDFNDFFTKFILHDPAHNIIGILLLIWFVPKLAPQAIKASFIKTPPIFVKEDILVVFHDRVNLEDVDIVKKTGTKMGVKINIYLKNGNILEYQHSLLKGFLWNEV